MKVYLDVCCLNRSFDDDSQPRVAVEAAAVLSLLELIDSGRLTDYSSEMARVEIERMPDGDRRRKVASLLPPDRRIMPLSDDLLDASREFVTLGFDLADSVHLAAAQKLGIDAFLTVDDKLLRRAARYASRLAMRVLNPLTFLQELGDANDR
jgi:predicted nucleic acid-binding protein